MLEQLPTIILVLTLAITLMLLPRLDRENHRRDQSVADELHIRHKQSKERL